MSQHLCQNCNKSYLVSKNRDKKTKYCSFSCRSKVVGKMAGKKGKGVSRNKGVKHPYLAEYNKLHIKNGENHPTWKGDDVGYHALHQWIIKTYGQPTTCEHCQTGNLIGCKIHWTNKSGEYKRDREDWLRLCAKCHKLYDKIHKHIKKKFNNHKLTNI